MTPTTTHSTDSHAIIDAVTAAGFPCRLTYTGGGIDCFTVALTESGFDGPTANMGEAGDTVADCYFGVMIESHPTPYDYHAWIGDHPGCPSCVALLTAEKAVNNELSTFAIDTVTDAVAWMVSTARRLDIAVTVHQNHA